MIVLTAKGGIDSAVEAMRAGANDFLVKPASPERITVSIRNAAQDRHAVRRSHAAEEEDRQPPRFEDLIAKAPTCGR